MDSVETFSQDLDIEEVSEDRMLDAALYIFLEKASLEQEGLLVLALG